MNIRLTPKKFGNFILLFLLDNIMNKSLCYTDNPSFKEVLDYIRKDSRVKVSILKAFFSDISLTDRGNYKLIRDSFFNKKYNMGNSILLLGKDAYKNMDEQNEVEYSDFLSEFSKEELCNLRKVIDDKIKEIS